MKKFTLLFFLVIMAVQGYGQCLGNYSLTTVASNNSGFQQQISAYAYTNGDYVTVTDLLIGKDYIFTCALATTEKYITVTDLENNVIEHGPSPLTLSSIENASVKVHYSDNQLCSGTAEGHLITIQMVLSCPFPTNLVLSNLGTTSASFEWEPTGSETVWEVIALPATSAAPAVGLTEGITVINDNPQFTATLSAATTYKFYYRAVCSDTEKSPWNSSQAFTTLCEAVTYFSEGFDQNTTIPTCFSKIGTTGTAAVQSESNAASSPNVLYMSAGALVSLPAVSNFDAATHRIKFKLRSIYNTGGNVEFGYLLDALDATSFVALETFDSNSLTEYNEYTFTPDASTETGNFAFKHLTENNNSIILDDIIWEPIPACPDVTSVQINSFTNSSATISWTSQNTAWEVVYGVAATTANPNNLIPQSVTENTVTISNLDSNTAYKFWVRSVCGSNASGAWIGPKTITTTCAPVTTFFENFDASFSIPACFKKVGNGGNAYVQNSVLNISSYLDGTTMSYGILALPAVTNAAQGTNRLKFKAKSSGGVIEIGYLTNPENGASFVPVHTITVNSPGAFQSYIYIPEAGVIPAEVMAFRHTGTAPSPVAIDDLIWESAPNCGDVIAVQAVDVSNASAKIMWTGTTETSWQVAYGATTVTDPNTLTPVAVSSVSNTVLNTLTASTTYKVWVRSNCGTSGFGAWIGPLQFTTSCDPVTSFSENFDASSNLPTCWTQSGGFIMTEAPSENIFYMSSNNVLGAPMVSNASSGTHRLKFKAKGMYGLGGTLEVGYMTSYNTASTFVAVESFTPSSTTSFDEFFVNLGTVPTTGYLAIRHNGVSYNSVGVDDIVWESLPTCEDLSDLAIDFATNNSVAVSWTASYSTAWQIVYTNADDDATPSDLTAVSPAQANYSFTNLDADSTYKFWVRADCGNGLYGSWIGPKEFKTTCEPIANLPWLESFENATPPILPECWTKGNGNWTYVDQTQLDPGPFNKTTPYSGTKYIRCYNEAVNNYMWTTGFQLVANTSYDFSTFVQGDGYDGWSVQMVSNTQPNATGAISFGAIYELPTGTGIQPYHEMRRTFIPTVSGVYYFAVKVNENSISSPYYIAFDDFSVETTNLSSPEFGTNTFTMYPNPVKDILNVSYTNTITNVTVFNLLGQQVLTKSINANNGQLDMSNLATGSYLVKVMSNNQVKTIKVIKQ